MDLLDLTLKEARDGLRARKFSSVDLTKAVLAEVEKREPEIHSFITLTPDLAMAQAREADAALDKGNAPPLCGVPIALKDIFCTRGVKTTCGSRILENFVPPFDATVTRKLRDAGAVIVGKANMDEFAMGSSTERSAFGPTRNPVNTACVPGGSSGGSAAAVAAKFAFGSIGTDTGGSIRQPAAFCGVVGMKPTYGRVSRYGMIAFASSLDQAGPFARNTDDAALLLQAIMGHDPLDSTSSPLPAPNLQSELEPVSKGLRLGKPKEYFVQGLDPEIRAAIDGALKKMESAGAAVEEVTLPHTEYAVPTYYVLAPAEASSNLSRFDGVRYGFRARMAGGPRSTMDGSGGGRAPGTDRLLEVFTESRSQGFGEEVKRRILIGTYALSAGYYDAYYLKALKVRRLIKQDYDRAFSRVDVIVTPTTPSPAFKLGEKLDDPLQMYLSDIFTIPCNLAGLCGISIPCGKTKSGLPIGLQILGKPLDEQKVLRVAKAFEECLR
ncbi:MAG: Asp-tRNA(Asn)/Glu-tRNA(Gln) amidotransferase subunit GatA [Nitrospirae bacterium]|nr:Asp-tRNA(Asn)/Glu-tRNA(Gln) amidotransferase subunit GatA [Nitrospirota bacterium]